MRVIVAAVLASMLLSGCWFVFIPGSAFGGDRSSQSTPRAMTNAQPDMRTVSAVSRRAYPAGGGAWCVDADTREGDSVAAVDGRKGKVLETFGSSTMCLDVRYSVKARLDIR